MLTMMPAQYGLSLPSSEELMLAMRKPNTMMETPKASCKKAISNGKRQPQHLLESFSQPWLECPLSSFLDTRAASGSFLCSLLDACPAWLRLLWVGLLGAFFTSFPMLEELLEVRWDWMGACILCFHSYCPLGTPLFVSGICSEEAELIWKTFGADCLSFQEPHIAQ